MRFLLSQMRFFFILKIEKIFIMPSRSESKKNPKILLVGSLSESSKLDLFINHEKCIKHQYSKNHQLGYQPAMGIQLNTLRL